MPHIIVICYLSYILVLGQAREDWEIAVVRIFVVFYKTIGGHLENKNEMETASQTS